MIDLPDVTVVAIDNVAHKLCRMALDATMAQISPSAVKVWADGLRDPPAYCYASDLPAYCYANPRSQEEVDEILWYKVPPRINTSHFLVVQWDGWVINGEAWRSEFLEYDYIGAPWWWHPDDHKVGNGGFSLRSTRLARYVAESPHWFPRRYPEDHHLCRTYRPALEAACFKWAPVEPAAHFSFEHSHPKFPTFGFHDIRNWPWVLSDADIDERLDAASAYVVKKTDLIQQMLMAQIGIRNQQNK